MSIWSYIYINFLFLIILNFILHNENQQRLNDLLKQREEQDNRIFQAIDIKPVSFQKSSETDRHLKTPK